MATIIIKNVGPIKEAHFELNKINVFMGPQSSGKSTIAKIISYCTWVEKRRMLDGFFRENFLERFKTFHNLGDTYFPPESYFKYEGDYCNIEFSKKEKPNGEIIVKENVEFDNSKHIYIPAERNFVASIPNLGRYKETNNNIMDFLYYWYEAKKSYSKNNCLSVPMLNISFYHIEEEDKDVIVLDKGKEIILRNASSGIQSMIPLYLLFNYLTEILYQKEIVFSPFEREKMKKTAKPLLDKRMNELLEGFSEQKEIQELLITEFTEERQEKILESVVEKYFKSSNYQHSQFIIEEPEQNLFPETQRDLIYYLLEKCVNSEREHSLTITTHSPYILYSLNNCMLGGLVNDKISEKDKQKIKCKSALINPEKVSIYEIHNGILKCIQDEDGLINSNYFDRNMKEVMDDFYAFLNYYE